MALKDYIAQAAMAFMSESQGGDAPETKYKGKPAKCGYSRKEYKRVKTRRQMARASRRANRKY